MSFAQISYIEGHRYHSACAEENTGQERKIYSHKRWDSVAGIQFQQSSTKHETNSGEYPFTFPTLRRFLLLVAKLLSLSLFVHLLAGLVNTEIPERWRLGPIPRGSTTPMTRGMRAKISTKRILKFFRPIKRDKVKMILRSEGTRLFKTSVRCCGVRFIRRISRFHNSSSLFFFNLWTTAKTTSSSDQAALGSTVTGPSTLSSAA